MGIYKIEQKRLPLREQLILNYVNFLACVLLASDWFKNNQLLSNLTHAHYRDTVPLSNKINFLSAYCHIHGTWIPQEMTHSSFHRTQLM